jgi:hypothetical protein
MALKTSEVVGSRAIIKDIIFQYGNIVKYKKYKCSGFTRPLPQMMPSPEPADKSKAITERKGQSRAVETEPDPSSFRPPDFCRNEVQHKASWKAVPKKLVGR